MDSEQTVRTFIDFFRDRGHGLVARCPDCEQVVLRLVRGPDAAWLDLRGTVSLRIPLSS